MQMLKLKDLTSRLCRDLVVGAFDDLSMPCVVTALNYPNGDSINLYFKRRGGRGIDVTDAGTTFDLFSANGFAVGHDDERMIETICRRSGVQIVGDRKHLVAPA